MNNIVDIGTWELVLGILSLIFPILMLKYYKLNLTKDIIISVTRMILQLFLVAAYLEWIFEHNNALLNSAWVFVMILVSTGSQLKRIGLNRKLFALAIFVSTLVTVAIIDTFFLGVVIKLEYIFDARYFIPITGMILGNALSHNLVGLNTYFNEITKHPDLYYFLLTNGSKQKVALRPYIGKALKNGLNPLLATMSVIGLISLPGMMTGQILGGSSPVTAIKYQILIMIAIFVGSTLCLVLTIRLANISLFNCYKGIRGDIMK